MADQLGHDVGAPVVGQLEHPLDALLRVRQLLDVDDLVGAEAARQLEPLANAVDDDHLPAPISLATAVAYTPEPAGALDHDVLAQLQAGQLHAADHLGQRAVDARRPWCRSARPAP